MTSLNNESHPQQRSNEEPYLVNEQFNAKSFHELHQQATHRVVDLKQQEDDLVSLQESQSSQKSLTKKTQPNHAI